MAIEREVQWDSLASSMRVYGELTIATLLAVEAGEISEGRAVELLMINREELREIRHKLIQQVTQLAATCKSPLTLLLATIHDQLGSPGNRRFKSNLSGKASDGESTSRETK